MSDIPVVPDNGKDTKPEKEKFSAADLFEDWSRPIGLIILAALMYIQFVKEQEVNDLYLVIDGVLLAGDKIANVLRASKK